MYLSIDIDGRRLERSHVSGHPIARWITEGNDSFALLYHPGPVWQLHSAERLLGHCRRQLGQRPRTHCSRGGTRRRRQRSKFLFAGAKKKTTKHQQHTLPCLKQGLNRVTHAATAIEKVCRWEHGDCFPIFVFHYFSYKFSFFRLTCSAFSRQLFIVCILLRNKRRRWRRRWKDCRLTASQKWIHQRHRRRKTRKIINGHLQEKKRCHLVLQPLLIDHLCIDHTLTYLSWWRKYFIEIAYFFSFRGQNQEKGSR